MSIKLNDNAMLQFRVSKVFQESEERKGCLDFSVDGRRLLVCDHSAMTIFSSTRQVVLCRVNMNHYLPEVACFTQQDSRALHSASKHDFAIRCLDLETRKRLRLFRGHSRRAHVLVTQPGNDNVFLSAGRDDKVFLWDLRSSTYTHRMKKLHSPLSAFDPAGLVFAIGRDTERIEMHDVRMLGQRPCSEFVYQVNHKAAWTQLQFAPDGKNLLVSTDHSWCFSVSALDGSFQQSFAGYGNETRQALEATYSPDSQFVLSGADEGRIHIWRADDGKTVAVLKGNNVGPVRCLRFNPRDTLFVSRDHLIVFWMPMANGVYDWVDPLKPGQTVSIKEEKIEDEVSIPKAPSMPKPMKDWGLDRQGFGTRNWRASKKSLPAVQDATQDRDRDLEEGEIPDD
ncbi:hypothetical protein KR009_004497 [Drosophila setifemur]|nr:hypothetical protein KR009_004497 [Drosophila setifemur]